MVGEKIIGKNDISGRDRERIGERCCMSVGINDNDIVRTGSHRILFLIIRSLLFYPSWLM